MNLKGEVKFTDMNKEGNFTKVEMDNINKKLIIDNDNDDVYINVNDVSLFASFGVAPVFEIVKELKKRNNKKN